MSTTIALGRGVSSTADARRTNPFLLANTVWPTAAQDPRRENEITAASAANSGPRSDIAYCWLLNKNALDLSAFRFTSTHGNLG